LGDALLAGGGRHSARGKTSANDYAIACNKNRDHHSPLGNAANATQKSVATLLFPARGYSIEDCSRRHKCLMDRENCVFVATQMIERS